MKIVLRADVEHLGQKGDLVDVADGYARNFLVPRGLALRATAGHPEAGRRDAPQPRRARSPRPGGRAGDRRPARAPHDPHRGARRRGRPAVRFGHRRPTSPPRCRPSSASRSTAATSRSTSRSRSSAPPSWPFACTVTSRRPCTSRSSRADPRARTRLSTVRPQRRAIHSCGEPGLWTMACRTRSRVPARCLTSSGHDPQCCGYSSRFSTGKSHGCASIDAQGERATFTSRNPAGAPPELLLRHLRRQRLTRHGSSPWSSRSTTQDDDPPTVAALRSRGTPPSALARIPPHNLEAEESLLGSMMLSREAITAAVEAHIEAGDFYKPAHGVIYEAALSSARPGRADRPGHDGRGAAALRLTSTRSAGSQALLRIQAVDAGVGELGALRPDRLRARDAAPPDRDRGRHPGDGVHERRRRRRDARPRRSR